MKRDKQVRGYLLGVDGDGKVTLLMESGYDAHGDALSDFACGCRVDVRDDGMHIHSCGDPEHTRAHNEAIVTMEASGIPIVERP